MQGLHGASSRSTAIVSASGIGAAVLVGIQAAMSPSLALASVAIVLSGVVLYAQPVLLALVVAPSAFVAVRLPIPGGLFPSDAIVVLAGALAAVSIDWRRNRDLVTVLAAAGALLALFLVSVLAAFSFAGVFEVAHRAAIVAGGLMVGCWLTQQRRGVLAVYIFVGVAAAIGLVAVIVTVADQFAPAYVFGIQKNYIGSLLSSAVIISFAIVEPRGIGRVALRSAQMVAFAGLVATQSKGALLGLAVGALAWAILNRRSRGVIFVLVLILIPILALTVQGEYVTGGSFSPTATRIHYAQSAIATWLSSPLLGNGLRFFNSAKSAIAGDPHDVFLLTLAESGVVGLAGMLAFLAVVWRQLVRRRDLLANTAAALLIARLAHGLLDVYWVHGSQEIPWIVAGMALSAGVAVAALGTRETNGVVPRPTTSPAQPG